MKDLLLGFLIGAILGLWFGVNLGKGQPIISNPFVEKDTMDQLSEQVGKISHDLTEKSKQLYHETKDAVNRNFEEDSSRH